MTNGDDPLPGNGESDATSDATTETGTPSHEPTRPDSPEPVADEVDQAASVEQASAEPPAAEEADTPEPAPVAPEPGPEPVVEVAAEPVSPAPEPAPEIGATKPQVGDSPAAKPTEQAEAGKGQTPPKPGAPPRAPRPAGRVLEGLVVAVSAEEVELKLDDGRPAVINRRNFGNDNEDPTTVLSVGDRAFGAELSREDPKARVVLSRAWALKRQAWDRVVESSNANTTLSGRVVSVGAKGVVVDVGVRGFVPSSHLEVDPVSDLSPYLEQVLELKVLEVDPQRERLVLSRRSLLLKEQRKKTQELLSGLKAGDTCRGKVTSITNYGAFVDIGGVNGLVHLSELSWKRVRRPNDVVALGDEIEVRILDVKAKKRRVSLSLRQMQPDPLSELEIGEVYRGPVTRLVDFGAFVALGEVEGLVHLSELAEYRVSAPEEVVAPGDEVGVKVLSVDLKRRRVELSIRRAAEFGG